MSYEGSTFRKFYRELNNNVPQMADFLQLLLDHASAENIQNVFRNRLLNGHDFIHQPAN